MAYGKFSEEYGTVRALLLSETFLGDLQKPMAELKSLLGVSGPELTNYAKLDNLRDVTLKPKETETILTGVGLDPSGTTAPTDKQAKAIALVKFLRHLYMISIRGSQTVWVYSTPKDFTKYTYDEVVDAKGSLAAVKAVVEKTTERFDSTTKSHFGEAIMLGLNWSQKAEVVLSTAKSNTKSKEKVNRWFAPADDDFDAVVGKLSAGFKKITNLLNNNKVIITDHPPDRSNPDKELTEAYVYTATETPRTIYVEKAMFENYNISVLHGMKKNWTRILVHECSHLEAATDDVGGYAFRGIKPGVKCTPENAAKNADSWAFFAADCGGALDVGDITRAIGGTGGNLDKLEKNWK